MPNNPIRALLLATSCLLMVACATNEVGPDILIEADETIDLAEQAGARDHAPLDLDEALELRARAAAFVEAGEAVEAMRWVERAALQARLAIVRAEASETRARADRHRAELQALREELRASFGDRFDEGNRP